MGNETKEALETGRNLYVKKIYYQIIMLAFLLHLSYVFMFYGMSLKELIGYNLFSVFFYCVMMIVAKKGYYKTAVTLIHLEVSVFAVVGTVLLGWELGFPLYLVALCSLTYFCPFKSRYIPYLFSLMEIILFIALKLFMMDYVPVYPQIAEKYQIIIYLTNTISSMGTILFIGFSSGVSALVMEQKLQDENASLSMVANYDQLTGLLRRYAFLERIEEYSQEKQVVVIGDIDDFKTINDTYGHQCGDFVLQSVADMIRKNLSESFQICRWGGEEFVFLFDGDNQELVKPLLEKLLKSISQNRLQYLHHQFQITMTFGLAQGNGQEDFHDILKRADDNLYYGKRNGKNQIVC